MKQKVLSITLPQNLANKNTKAQFSLVYFNSTTKTVIDRKLCLDKFFQEILYRIDDWINESFGWIIESIEYQYINGSTFRQLIGSSYIKLPAELRSPKKGLINIKNIMIKNIFFRVILGILIQ